MKTIRLLPFISAIILISACEKEPVFYGSETGTPIEFGASTGWINDVDTRTEYSGKDQNDASISKNTQFERIDWVVGYDLIRVLCDAAVGKSTPSKKTADYVISYLKSNAGEKEKSKAGIDAFDDNALQWGTGAHYFYALYPAPGQKSNYTFSTGNTVTEANSKIESVSGNKAKITGVIPATQYAAKKGNVFKANMNYAYMYARTTATPGTSSANVTLDFYPLVTTFEVRLKGISSDLISSKLTSLKLSSKTTALTGTFNATIASTGNPTIATSGTGKEITITVPNGGTTLSATEAQTFTFLALPVEQKELTLTLIFANGTTRKIDLKKDGSFITVPACKKVYVDNLGVPNSLYYFDVVGEALNFSATGGSGEVRNYSVKSYVNKNGGNTGVGWTAKYSTDNGATWTSTKPSWLATFTASDPNGSLTDKNYPTTVTANTETTPKRWMGSLTITLGNNTSAKAIDLSLRDIYGNTISCTTANCYVVNSPGWYKFPLVYGNAIKNGQTNTAAYSNSNSDRYALKKFVRHDDQPIVDPWIKNNGITVTTAEMLWQDQQYLISTTGDQEASPNVPFIQGDYLYFYVNEGYIKQGNSVLAAKDASGTIVWSWHIWVMDDLDRLKTVKTSTNPNLEPTGTNVSSVDIMGVNLGWYDANETTKPRSVLVRFTQNDSGMTEDILIVQRQKNIHGSNLYYQWGRKDPELGSSDTLGEDHTQYALRSENYFTISTTEHRVSIGTAIQHPNVFYTNTHTTEYRTYYSADNYWNYGWCLDRYDNLWNANGKFDTDIAVVKTVYDPCPVGFKIPNRDAFTGLYHQPDGYPATAWNYGVEFNGPATGYKDLFFPSTSLREEGAGNIRVWFTSAYNQTACLGHLVYSTETEHKISVCYLQINEPSLDGHTSTAGAPVTAGTSRAGTQSYGFSVRPIAE